MTRHLRLPMHPSTTDKLCGDCGARNTQQRAAVDAFPGETWCDNGMLHDGDTAPLVPVMSSARKGASVVNAERHERCIAAEETR